MTVSELCRFFEARLPRALAASWDNDGLSCCPDGDRKVRRALVALDATEEAVDRAVAGGFDLLLTHHPLLFRPLRALTPETAVPRKLLRLAAGGVAAMSFHTRLDAAPGGVNDCLAALFQLSAPRPFGPPDEPPCGRIGDLPAPISVEELAAQVCARLRAAAVRVAGAGRVRRMAVLGGEGGDFLDAARAAGAEVFLTGSAGYHRMLDAAEEGLAVIEAGHYETEYPVTKVLAALLGEAVPGMEIEIMPTAVIGTVAAGGEGTK